MQVSFNGTKLPIKTFQDYVGLYIKDKDKELPRVYERFSDRWEICVSPSDDQFQQVCCCVATHGTHAHVRVDQSRDAGRSALHDHARSSCAIRAAATWARTAASAAAVIA